MMEKFRIQFDTADELESVTGANRRMEDEKPPASVQSHPKLARWGSKLGSGGICADVSADYEAATLTIIPISPKDEAMVRKLLRNKAIRDFGITSEEARDNRSFS